MLGVFMRRRASLIFWLSFIVFGTSHADLVYNGNGCPEGTADWYVDDNGAWHLLLSAFNVEINANRFERKACNIAVALNVPEGYSANFGAVSLTGYYDIQQGAHAVLEADPFFAGSVGPHFKTRINGGSSGNIEFNYIADVWSACGQSPILRLNTSLFLRGSSRQQESVVILDEIVIGKPLLTKC
jgi:hypothetical protein